MKKLLEWLKSKLANNRATYLVEKSEQLYDVSVYKKELWFVYNGNLVCPMKMFEYGEDVSKVVCKMRDMFVERNKIDA